MAISVKLLENPTERQIKQAIAVALAAFEGDLCAKNMTGGNESLQELLFRSMVGAGAVEGSFFTVSDGADNIVSIGIWFKPGKVMMDSEAQQKAGWTEFYNAISPEAQDWWMKEFYPRHDAALTACMGPNITKNSWFANLIATHPSHQRKGCASAIVKEVCQLAAADGVIVALGTQNESNVAWYEKLGFKLKDRIEFGTEETPWGEFLLSYDSKDVIQL
ncbi:hypothetical protein BU17DRAFT_88105 [Hysterangium stoloniferum]|nr:hypothetical protein BU17DRAFT_88105 [Hysterangium stoloniferum]